MDSKLVERIERLEAIEAIKHLKARYCALCDANYDPDGLAALFTRDAVWDGGTTFGRHVGRDAIRAFFAGVSEPIVFAAHLVLNPIIDVHGPDSATARWRLLMPCTTKSDSGPEARWLLVSYIDEYSRVDGTWLFSSMAVTVNFFAPHRTGWA